MKKLKTFILAALTAVGACAAFGGNSYIQEDSTVWFDTSTVPDCSDYNTVYILRQGDYGEWVDNGSSLSSLQETYDSANFSDGSATEYDGGKLSFTNDFLVASRTFSDPVVFLFTDEESGYFLVDGSCVTQSSTIDQNVYYKISMQEANAFTSADLKPFDRPVISAVSAEGWLDLTVGDRVAEDEETLVVDPAWGEATSATVDFTFGGSTVETRTYNCASNDTWQTARLTPGRYTLALEAGTNEESAAFWKIDGTWEVLDLPKYNEGILFPSDKTFLLLGVSEVPDDKPLTVEDGAKFEYAEGAGFKGGKLEMPRRYRKETVDGDVYRIVEAVKGSEDNPWTVGEGVEAYTNGTELVIVGEGTITDLSEIPVDIRDGLGAITIAEATVTGALAGAFDGSVGIALTLPDNWQGELPKNGAWYGATDVELTGWPMAVRNVKPQQRYPWNGLVDVNFDLMGEGFVSVAVSVTTNGVAAVVDPTVTGETTFDLGDGGELKGCRITWDAKADFGDEELHEKIKVKLTVEKAEAD